MRYLSCVFTERSLCGAFAAGDWKVWITTEECVREADEIVLVVYGEEANSGPIILWTGEDNGQFQTGNNDEFKARHFFLSFWTFVNCVL